MRRQRTYDADHFGLCLIHMLNTGQEACYDLLPSTTAGCIKFAKVMDGQVYKLRDHMRKWILDHLVILDGETERCDRDAELYRESLLNTCMAGHRRSRDRYIYRHLFCPGHNICLSVNHSFFDPYRFRIARGHILRAENVPENMLG